ncbi:DNA polymerase III alpha subunit [Lactococcus phage AM4]|uniref:DNA polymerase III alpha subunit n=2 Tax=Audreyjarvisvirus AM4 TaxID=2845189 RepID=A0A1W6JKM2_9CAUD|nr:DNA polymerase [Lactococcus phage AM4]ARM66763.1 DNA polymerase III alpha subunit [Lactococcus phage AM4]ARM66996.1 DNA polymerase III alpha subunit [Lactococcus phage AM5]
MTDLNTLTYQNIHSHSFYSNISTHDSVISRTDVAERAVELGHTTLSCIEHGYMGNVFETYRIAKQFNLKLIFGTEFYYVKDRFEKDRTNSHLLVVAKNENGKEAITGLISESYQTGFYGRNRIDEELLFSLPKDDVIVTTACIASPINLYEGYAEYFIPKAKAYFGDNFFLEVQPHWNKKQADFNKKLVEYRKEYNVPFILGVDTHYIKEEDYKMRDIYLKSRKIIYDKEEGFFMDYPETKIIIERFNKQAVLSDEQITEAFNNSHIVDKFDSIEITDDIKMPSVYPDKTEKEKVEILKKHINKAWIEDRKHIPRERHKEYIEAIKSEMSIVENTHMVDYFLMNEKIITLGKEKYGGVLTMTGRGSSPSFYLNKLLDFTAVDRVNSPLKLYPTRFMSESRILEAKSLPDVDFNTANPEPFMRAQKEILGEDNAYQMIAYGTMQEKDAFKTYCRGLDIPKNEYWTIAEDLERWVKTDKWRDIIKTSQQFIGVVTSFSPHPCSSLLLSDPISRKIGVIKTKEGVDVALIGSYDSDVYKYLKNDLLVVTVWDIIAKVCKELDIDIPDVRTLTKLVENNDKVWDLYKDGMVATLNQAGTPSGKPQVMQYKPQSVRELSMWVAGIRPSFASMKSYFLNRQPFSYNIPAFDELLKDSDNFVLFQESIMATLQFAGYEEDVTYGLLKAIAKKKKGIIEPIHDKFIEGFVAKTGSEEQALKVWTIIENAVNYGFNSSHAYSVALDSLYGAWLKATYPLVYFAVVLNVYKNSKDKQAELINELEYFDISLKGLQFGKSKSDYSYETETNTIYKGISTVAYLNQQVSDNLYNLANEKHYEKDDIVQLFLDILEGALADNRQMNILIKLGFFKEFGEESILLELYNTMTGYQAKKPNPIFTDNKKLDVKYSRTHKEKTKLVRIENIKEYYGLILNNAHLLPTTNLFDRLTNEVEYMGYAETLDQSLGKNVYVVMDINTKYTPVYTLYNMYDGHISIAKIDKKKAYRDTKSTKDGELIIKLGDQIEIMEFAQRPKMALVDGKWESNYDQMQDYIEHVRLIERYEH